MEEIDFIQPKKTVGKLISVDVLDKIRDEIEKERSSQRMIDEYFVAVGLRMALEIIDKYKSEIEE